MGLALQHVADLAVAAASGLVRFEEHLYVVADDEAVIAVHDRSGSEVDCVILDGEARGQFEKAAKPDLESLALTPDGWLMTLGSGSTEKRERGWLWRPGASPREFSLSELYGALRPEVGDLNIEGAAFAGDRLWLAQRGNGADGRNAIIEIATKVPDTFVGAGEIAGIVDIDVGDVDGVPLTFSDFAPLPDGRLLFCAVAEATDSTYHDGECVGSVVGVVDPRRGAVQRVLHLEGAPKVEGVTLASQRDLDLLFIADDDDASTPAPLLAGRL